MNTIITRFPPSPTGYLHIGGARTAIFNWLYAKHNHGRFVLRIEDTDTQRSTQESVDAIFEAMEWLGLDWDDGPHFQSKRTSIYESYIQKLLDTGHAYACSCPPERLEEIRKQAMESGGKPKYDGACREKGLKPGDDTVIRFKSPLTGTTVLEDVIKGNIAFQNAELDDFIIARSDGTPTYNFCVVVDDVTMGITHVIRGDDHVNNTPRQILLYKALGAKLPIFGHVPMVMGSDKTRLSKRHGAMSVTAYRDMGYLPEAVINYLVRLGWSHGDQEYFTREELIEKFSLEHIGVSPGVFNPEKLTALNAEHIRNAPTDKLAGLLVPFLAQQGVETGHDTYLESVVETLAPRSKTLVEMAESALFYYGDGVTYEEKAAKKFLKPDISQAISILAETIQAMETEGENGGFTEAQIEAAFHAVMEQTELKLGKIAQPVRVALTGKTASPGIFEVVSILGKDRTLKRLKDAVDHIAGKR